MGLWKRLSKRGSSKKSKKLDDSNRQNVKQEPIRDMLPEAQPIDDFEDEFQYHVNRELIWNSSHIWRSLGGIYGSVWPRVIPYCILNCCWAGFIWSLKAYHQVDLTVNKSGHKYAAALMSFLLVIRLKINFERYMKNAAGLAGLLKYTRELVAHVCMLTSRDTGIRAQQWRQDVTYSALVFLRACIVALQFKSRHKHPELFPEFDMEGIWSRLVPTPTKKQKQQQHKDSAKSVPNQPSFEDVDQYVDPLHGTGRDTTASTFPGKRESLKYAFFDEEGNFDAQGFHTILQLVHVPEGHRKSMEEAFRTVGLLAFNLRWEITKQRDGTWFQEKVRETPCGEELLLMGFVQTMMKNFSRVFENVSTPFPFPLVQMTKTFLFIWVFTIPLALISQRLNELIFIIIITVSTKLRAVHTNNHS